MDVFWAQVRPVDPLEILSQWSHYGSGFAAVTLRPDDMQVVAKLALVTIVPKQLTCSSRPCLMMLPSTTAFPLHDVQQCPCVRAACLCGWSSCLSSLWLLCLAVAALD